MLTSCRLTGAASPYSRFAGSLRLIAKVSASRCARMRASSTAERTGLRGPSGCGKRAEEDGVVAVVVGTGGDTDVDRVTGMGWVE